MFTFKDFIQDQDLINRLKKQYLKQPLNEVEQEHLEKILERVSVIKYKSTKDDQISSIFEDTIDFNQRKEIGEIYTPLRVVNYILCNVGYTYKNKIIHKKLIDISCGSGSFLIEAISILKSAILKEEGYAVSEFPHKKLIPEFFNVLQKNIHGVDINPISCILCQLNLFLSIMDIIHVISRFFPDYQFPLFKIINANTLSIDFQEKYDFVVGNPPYLFLRDIPLFQKKLIKSLDLKTKSGQYDLYQLFTEIGINILHNKGRLGFILPDSILALSNRKTLRKYIHQKTKIKLISVVGSQFNEPVVSNIVIIIFRERNKSKRLNNFINISIFRDGKHYKNKIPQRLIEDFGYKFLINLDPIDINILSKIAQNPTLNSIINDKQRFEILIGRGVEIGKLGRISYCDSCDKFMPRPKGKLRCRHCFAELKENVKEVLIQKKPPIDRKSEYRKLLYAINRYRILEYRYINVKQTGINYKDRELYKNRIIIRQLNQNNLICATFDQFSYTTQSFYNLKIKKSVVPEFTNFYLLGLLNSNLLSYHFNKSFGSYKRLFPRILIEKIKSLPIKIPSTDKEKALSIQIAEKVKYLLKKNDANPSLMNQIDNLVFQIYGIDDKIKKHVNFSLNQG